MAEYLPDRIFAPAEAIQIVADSGQTPFFLYHKQGILDSIHEIHRAFSWLPGYQNYFPLRENANPQILKLLAEAGTGVSACNLAELSLAKASGFSENQVLYEPSRRDPAAEALAKELRAIWMFNGAELIPEELPSQVILRYHPSDQHLTSVQFPAVRSSKNGLTRDQLMETVEVLHIKGVKHIGLALQVSDYSIKPGIWENRAETLFALIQEIHEKLHIRIWCCHIGEGPGLPYRPRKISPSVAEEAHRLQAIWTKLPQGDRPLLITGISKQLMERNGLSITKILEQRTIYRTFLVLDCGMCQYIRPALKQAYRHVSVLGQNQIEDRKLYSLVGELPNEIDRLVQKGRMLPKVNPGDYCVIHDVGCGARYMPMLYGMRPVAAEYLYETDGSIRLIAKRHSEQDVMEFLTAL